ncbi:hypothetical protein CF098_07825 [Clostridium sporogenes]
MDELRSLVVIVPTLVTIIISFICLFFNSSYNAVKNKFNPIINEYSKPEGISASILIILCSISVAYLFLIMILPPTLHKIKNENMYNMGSFKFTIVWAIIVTLMFIGLKILRRDFKKILFNVSSNNRGKFKYKFIMRSTVLILLCAIFMILTLTWKDFLFGKNISINWNNNKIFTKATIEAFENKSNKKIYVNGKEYILYNKYYQEKKLATLGINVNHKKLYFYVDKDLKVVEGDSIKLKENDKYIVKDEYKSYKKWIIVYENISVILLPIMFIVIISSMCFTLEKFYSIRKYIIKYSKTSCIGELWFEYDNFYLVKVDNKFKYISKNDVNELNCIEYRKDNTEMNVHLRIKEFFKKSTINCLAAVAAIFIFIYEYWFYNKLGPFGRIFIELSYAYIGGYIFYILLRERDKYYNKRKAEKILIPMLKNCIGAYKEFIEGFPNYGVQNKIWNKLEEEEFINLGKGITFKDEYKHCSINYYCTEEEKKHTDTYLNYIKDLLSKILKQLQEVRIGLDILDDEIIDNVWALINEINEMNKSIDLHKDINKNNLGDLRNVMIHLFKYHKLIVKLDNDIKQVYGNEK